MNMDIKFIDGNTPPHNSDFYCNKNIFINRRKNTPFLLIILAGYKSYLFDDVFDRVKNYAPKNLDICITSSGLYDEKLEHIARKNNWSYLITKVNNIPMAQNLSIMIHEKAEMIYKMDEDIFVTENCFEKLLQTFKEVQQNGHYNIGFVAPLIPINGYGHVRILEILGLDKFYEQKFEKILYGAQPGRMIEKNPDVAKFMWGEGNIIPSIDKMNAAFQMRKISYNICSTRFSIGMILFHKNLWKIMGGWKIPPEGDSGIGRDEEQICIFCMAASLGMIISENVVVGHLSFGQQNEAMKEYYLNHREVFRCPIVKN